MSLTVQKTPSSQAMSFSELTTSHMPVSSLQIDTWHWLVWMVEQSMGQLLVLPAPVP